NTDRFTNQNEEKNMKMITKFVYAAVVAFALACFALEPRAGAVMPAPDGGYPGGNTAEGQNALLSLTTGGFNTAVGWFSLRSNTTGSYNTATGAGALFVNSTGGNNTAIGLFALQNSTGDSNIALGGDAGFNVTTASDVIAIGSPAANVSDSCFIAHIRGVIINDDAIPVLIDGSGRLGTIASS